MSKQMMVFTIVWLFIIILFVCTGQLVFYELVSFSNLTTSFTYLIESALGSWDLNIFLNPRKYSCEIGNSNNCYFKPRPFYD
jgi:tryptophan-rich sensory protein